MGLLKSLRARTMGISPRMYEILERVQPYFVQNSLLRGNPDASMDIFGAFANEHGRERLEDLTDREVADFITLLRGIDLTTHPDNMARANKYGCDACRRVYVELLWRLIAEPVLENLKSGAKGPEWDALTPEQQRDLINNLAEQEKFLNS